VPEDYLLFRAARWLGVAPWELAEREVFWMVAALDFEAAEHEGMELRRQHDAAVQRVPRY
jgi:hypothetical protein